jgi:integrase
MMTWAIKRGDRPDRQNPCKGIERYTETKKQRFLTTAEVARLGAVIRQAEAEGLAWDIDPDKPKAKHLPKNAAQKRGPVCPFAIAAVRLLLFTGARRNEIVKLQWAHVDLDARLLKLSDHKTARRTGVKTIALSPAAALILANLPRIEGNPYMIAGRVEGKARFDLSGPWNAIRKLAGLEGFRLHDLRHSSASHAKNSGVSIDVVGDLLGHKNISTTMGYAHLFTDALTVNADRVGKHISDVFDGKHPAPGESKRTP